MYKFIGSNAIPPGKDFPFLNCYLWLRNTPLWNMIRTSAKHSVSTPFPQSPTQNSHQQSINDNNSSHYTNSPTLLPHTAITEVEIAVQESMPQGQLEMQPSIRLQPQIQNQPSAPPVTIKSTPNSQDRQVTPPNTDLQDNDKDTTPSRTVGAKKAIDKKKAY